MDINETGEGEASITLGPRLRSDRTDDASDCGHVPDRVIKLEKTAAARRSVYVPLKRRAARFLEALAESGNVSLACEVAGIGKDRIYRHRRENPEFARDWDSAKAAFAERAEAEDGIDLDALGRDGLAVRRGRGGAVQIVAAHPEAWTRHDEEAFFAHYGESANVAAAARAAGFSAKAAWERARTVPAFGERLAAEKAAATDRLEHLLIAEGTNLLKGEGGAAPDPQLAMWLLKREDQKAAGTLKRGAAFARSPPIEEVTAKIVRQVEAIKRHRRSEQRAQGWTETEDGHWIPPGYGRVSGDGCG